MAGLRDTVCFQALQGKRATLVSFVNLSVTITEMAQTVNRKRSILIGFFAVHPVPNRDRTANGAIPERYCRGSFALSCWDSCFLKRQYKAKIAPYIMNRIE